MDNTRRQAKANGTSSRGAPPGVADAATRALEQQVADLSAELASAREQQSATSEILRVISASPADVKPVFEAIVKAAVRLFAGAAVAVVLPVGEEVRLAAIREADPARAQLWRERFPFPLTREYMHGTALLERRVVDVPDVLAPSGAPEPGLKNFIVSGYRAVTIMPMLREDACIGAISVIRLAPGPLSDKQIALLNTFADQAVIAIENVRLFNEIQEKSRELEAANHQLDVANRHKSEFLAGMSHELRTPLNAVIGFSEVLQEQMFGEINSKQAEYLEDIHSSSIHLLSLINDILDLSKIEAGRMDLELSRFDLPTALDNALTLVRERATRNNIGLRLECEPELADWTADERKFKQIALNLLSNAVKFTPSGGTISVHARRAKGCVEVAVSDTGVGIKPEDQPLVFEEFRQVGGDALKKSEGTGLGLALTKKFVELHGGEMRLDSAIGKGSTFTFTLPEAWLQTELRPHAEGS
jgi:signal transduction histidine kinase